MRKFTLAFFIVVVPALAGPACSRNEADMNAFMLVDSQSLAFNEEFQKYLAENGARIIRAFPPRAFIGYVPPALDKTLKKNYGAMIYRARIEDMDRLAVYGESIIYAANVWNKRFLEDPPEAPLVISYKVRQAKKGETIALSWNSVMKAVEYRLEISRDADFKEAVLEASPKQNRYELFTAFFADGVYYWRVAALLTLNTGEKRQGRFSDVYSFAVSKPSAASSAPLAAPAVAKTTILKGIEPVAWEKNPVFKHYRVQVARTDGFSDLIADDFTDNNFYRIHDLPLGDGVTYYMRVMGASGPAAGPWSKPCEIRIEK